MQVNIKVVNVDDQTAAIETQCKIANSRPNITQNGIILHQHSLSLNQSEQHVNSFNTNVKDE